MCYLYFLCLHCCLINIHIFDYPDSRLSGLFTEVPTSPDNRGSTVHENHSCQASESALRLFCTTWSTWNNPKGRSLKQSSFLMWRFPWSCRRSFLNSLLAMMTAPSRQTSLENKHLRNCDYLISFAFYNVNDEPCNWISLSAVRVNAQNYRWTVVCSSIHQYGKFGNFTLLFSRGGHGLVHKSVPHVQHDYFSTLDQSGS